MAKLAWLIGLFILAALPVRAGDVSQFTLKNGMQVLVIEDHRAPVVVHMVWYRIGAADEPAGHSGIAHFLEHLLFQGTDDLAPGELSKTVEANGGSDNAFTSWDYTAFFQRVAADRLGLMMKMEADRMRDLLLTPEDVATERDVILEERAQRIDTDPGALFSEQARAAQYLNHPYGVPVIGWRREMEQLTREDAFDFYRLYYAPNNAVLIVAGDVTPDQVRTLAEEYYEPLEPSVLPERARPQEPPQLAERRLTYSDPRVAQPYVMRSYLAPTRDHGNQRQAAALTLLAELLGGNGTTSLLARALQFESQRVVYAGARYDGLSLDDTTFGFFVAPVEGVSLEESEADLDAVIARFLREGVDTDELDRVKTQIRAAEIYALDDAGERARRYGEALTTGLTVEDVDEWPATLQSITPEEIMEAARAVFDRRHAVTGFVQREGA